MAVAVPVQGVLAFVGMGRGLEVLADQRLGDLQLNPNPGVVRASVLDSNDLGNGVAIVALAGLQNLLLLEVFKSSISIGLLLDQIDLYITDGKSIRRSISIRQIRQRAANREDRHHGDGQRENEDLLLGHE